LAGLVYLEKHGVPFERAALVFEEHLLRKVDTRHDYGEQWFIAVGVVGAEIFVLVYTERADRVRLISAWKGGAEDKDSP
jgi:uncharacterized protein